MNFDGFEETLRDLLGRDIPVTYRGNNSGVSINFTPEDIRALNRRRPGSQKLKELQQDRSKADEFLSAHATSTDSDDRVVSCDLLRGRADELCKRGQHEEATFEYERATKAVLGQGFVFPLPNSEEFRNEAYTKLEPWERIVLMECCNGMAQCLIKMNSLKRVSPRCHFRQKPLIKFPTAFRHVRLLLGSKKPIPCSRTVTLRQTPLYSVSRIQSYTVAQSINPLFTTLEWMSHYMEVKEYFSERVTALKTAADVFYDLGNTGMAAVLMNTSLANATRMPSHLDPTKSVKKIIDNSKLVEFVQLRHPDPKLVPTIEIKDETMQVYGSWKKVKLEKTGGIPSRMGFASFLYQGKCRDASYNSTQGADFNVLCGTAQVTYMSQEDNMAP
jgi:hypothetical protein